MLAIRLQRMGKKNRPSYRVVLSEKKRDLYGNHNEILGNYDPCANPKTISIKADRIKYWLSQGAQASATVHNLLVSQGIIEGKKVKAWVPKKKEKSEEKSGEGAAPASAPEQQKPEEKQPEPSPAEEKAQEKTDEQESEKKE